jgi:hypothetical protein
VLPYINVLHYECLCLSGNGHFRELYRPGYKGCVLTHGLPCRLSDLFHNFLVAFLHDPSTCWLTDCITDWQMCQLTDGCVNWLIHPAYPIPELTASPTDRPIDWPTDWPTDQPTDRPTDWPTDQPTDRPTNRLTDRLTDRLTGRLTHRPTDRLTD